ncbi:hypothetical protein NL108_017067 [Boleophthalmus pectinirostris]|nr:hypothetical protein NL108_017067 [Boleophthalmus pectinirostris]
MSWEDAELKLKEKPDGSFLVRDSSDPRYILSLSFRSQSVTHHTRMEHYRGTFSLWCHPKFEDRCHSVVEFIERAIAHSKNGRFLYFLRSRVPGLPPTPVQLLYPVSRFSSVKTLQHLCRFCIRQTVRIDHIQDLPLPTPLILYLRKFYYYDADEEVQKDETQTDETRADETRADETRADETRDGRTRRGRTRRGRTRRADETRADETRADETRADETQTDETRADETRADETRTDETQTDETQTEQGRT